MNGPYTIPAGGQLHNNFATVDAPCTDCRITDIAPSLVYSDGTTANLNNGAMLHHFVLINSTQPDLVCPSGLQGQFGERFFAAGNERSHLHLPSPYGYTVSATTPHFLLIYHLVNKDAVNAKTVYVQVTYRTRPTSETQPVRPLWLDIDGCGDSEYTAAVGYSDNHSSWASTVSGRIIGIGGHLHDVDITNATPCLDHCDATGRGIAVSAELVGGSSSDYFGPIPPNNPPPSDLTGATICRSQGYYGTTWAGTQWRGHLDTMSQCGIFNGNLPAGAQAEAYPAGGAFPQDGYPLASGQTITLHSEYQNNNTAPQTDVMGIMAAWFTTPPGYPRAKGATPVLVSLVPAFKQCLSPNSTHGTPLASPSCNPPVQESSFLTVGSPDANTHPANATGSVRLDTITGNPATTADEANLALKVNATDVRNKSDLTDYTGQLQANVNLRITDQYSTGGPGTAQDLGYTLTVPCVATGGTTDIGSTCSVNTTADAVIPNTIREGKRTSWELGQVQLFDGGSDGVASTGPNTVFERQGIFAP
jgi:hypothetical protein